MAKIIDFKTRKVLAVLPSVPTMRKTQKYVVTNGPLEGMGLLARDTHQARAILDTALGEIQNKKKAA